MIASSENQMQIEEVAVTSTENDIVPAHHEPAKSDTPESPGGGRTFATIFALALVAAIAYGLHLRSANERTLVTATNDAAILTVHVASPTVGSSAQDLVLPGNVQAFT